MAATNAAYNYWLYELCDVYIVRPSSFLCLGCLDAVFRKR
jgi:hypothetical protein